MSIELHVDGAVATVTINRPEKKNAMLLAMRDALADVCEQHQRHARRSAPSC